MVRIREVAFCTDCEGAPLGGKGGEDAGRLGKELFWKAECEAFADTGFRIGEEAGVWGGLGKGPAGGCGLLALLN